MPTQPSQLPLTADGLVPATSSAAKKASSRKKKSAGKRAEAQPYEGVFGAELNVPESSSVLEIRDLRENVRGGDKTWTGPVSCYYYSSDFLAARSAYSSLSTQPSLCRAFMESSVRPSADE
ncbi:hypothetical protein DL768_011357 [Monosporascus sp. mg162]|nr:hypothetical protein DL768_011357 [Monosporascus sp. mg162]